MSYDLTIANSCILLQSWKIIVLHIAPSDKWMSQLLWIIFVATSMLTHQPNLATRGYLSPSQRPTVQLTCIKPCQADGAVVSLSTGGRKKETSVATGFLLRCTRICEKYMRPWDPTKDRPVSYFQGISSNFGYIKQKISKLNFQSNKAKLVHPSKPESFQQESPPKKKIKTWVCGRVLGFTAEPLRSPGASSESSAANLARTGTKPQPWWHGDGSGPTKWSYPYHPCMVHLPSIWFMILWQIFIYRTWIVWVAKTVINPNRIEIDTSYPCGLAAYDMNVTHVFVLEIHRRKVSEDVEIVEIHWESSFAIDLWYPMVYLEMNKLSTPYSLCFPFRVRCWICASTNGQFLVVL